MNKAKKFEKPIACIIEFENNDIITSSGNGDIGGIGYPWWGGGGGFDGPDTPADR